jgi:hypothetical protein
MKRKFICSSIILLINSLIYAQGVKGNNPSWYDIAVGIIAVPAAIVGLYYSIIQIKKIKLETESIQLDLEQKKRNLNEIHKLESELETPAITHPKIQVSKIAPEKLSITRIFSRAAIGILAILLPIILVIGSVVVGGDKDLQDSLGMYYYTNMKDIYIIVHCLIAALLFSYRGYARIDKVVSNIEGLFCLLIGICPTSSTILLSSIHSISFVSFLLLHSYFSLFLFTRSSVHSTKQKLVRNNIYRICGITIILSLFLILVYYFFTTSKLQTLKPVFFLETVAYWAFGTSWLTKGNYILKGQTE